MDDRARLAALLTMRRAAESTARRDVSGSRAALQAAESRLQAAESRERESRRRLSSAEEKARLQVGIRGDPPRKSNPGGSAGRWALLQTLVAGCRGDLAEARSASTVARDDRLRAQQRLERSRAALEQAIHAREAGEAEESRHRTRDARARGRREQDATEDAGLGRKR